MSTSQRRLKAGTSATAPQARRNSTEITRSLLYQLNVFRESELRLADPIEPLREGVSYRISGTLPLYFKKFSFNFMLENLDVALHVNTIIPENQIVRNSRTRLMWGVAEVADIRPFITLQRGEPVYIQVLVTEDAYLIAANGRHICDFKHRLPLVEVKSLDIRGDINNLEVQRIQFTKIYPTPIDAGRPPLLHPQLIQNPHPLPLDQSLLSLVLRQQLEDAVGPSATMSRLDLPYYARLPKKCFSIGYHLQIMGHIKLGASTFSISLQKGYYTWPQPKVAFRMRACYKTHDAATTSTMFNPTIYCDYYQDNKWHKKVELEMNWEMYSGSSFTLTISANEKEFRVFVYDLQLLAFPHIQNAGSIDVVHIDGDLDLWDVKLFAKDDDMPRRSMQSRLSSQEDEAPI